MARTNAVTLPIVLDATETDREGVLASPGMRSHPVRRLKPEDWEPLFEALREDQRHEFGLIIELIKAYKLRQKKAWKATLGKYKRLLAAHRDTAEKIGLRGPEDREKNQDFGRFLIDNELRLGLDLRTKSPGRAEAIFSGYALGSHAKSSRQALLLQVLSKHLRKAELVLWWSKDDGFFPAIYCGSLNREAALYIRAALSLITRSGFAVCRHPRCGVLFEQKRPDQQYCSIAHREAHRVARWRMKRAQTMRRKKASHGKVERSRKKAR